MRNVPLFGSLFGSLGLGLLIAAAGCEPVDDGSTSRAKGWDPVKDGLSDVLLDGDRGVFIDTDETMDVEDGCVKTRMDAHAILQNQCAMCHDQGPASLGIPTFDFVMNDTKMKTETWVREAGAAPIPFIDVGKPMNSAIFIRVGLERNMPPIQRDLGQPYYDRVTLSGVSVLQEWITKCM